MTPIRKTLAGFIKDKARAVGSARSDLTQGINKLAIVVNVNEWTAKDCKDFASLAGHFTPPLEARDVTLWRLTVTDLIERARR